MAHQVMVLASKPEDLSSVPETYVVEGKRHLAKAVL